MVTYKLIWIVCQAGGNVSHGWHVFVLEILQFEGVVEADQTSNLKYVSYSSFILNWKSLHAEHPKILWMENHNVGADAAGSSWTLLEHSSGNGKETETKSKLNGTTALCGV